MKLHGDSASYACSTLRWRAASFRDICLKSQQSCLEFQKVLADRTLFTLFKIEPLEHCPKVLKT